MDGDAVWFAMSTPASTANGGDPALYDVYRLPRAAVDDPLPFQYVPWDADMDYLGPLGDVFPAIRDKRRYPTIASFCHINHVGQWYRHWVGYSLHSFSLDERHHALDVYWQPPRISFGPVWFWYVMPDQIEPAEYWRGRMLRWMGKKFLGMQVQMPSAL